MEFPQVKDIEIAGLVRNHHGADRKVRFTRVYDDGSHPMWRACGIPDAAALQQRVTQGYRFIAYSIYAAFLAGAAELAIRPDWKD